MSSSFFWVYKCSELSKDLELIKIETIKNKCYRMPFWSSKNNDDPDANTYIVAELLHFDESEPGGQNA